MNDMRLPNWVRATIVVSTLMQLVFGITLLIDPDRIAEIWPWPLPPLTARMLGASTLVSIPLALLAVGINRFSVAMIPLVMLLTYRVLQLVAGAMHFDRFAGGALTTLNYFGGGLLMLIVFAYPLWAGLTGKLPAAAPAAPFVEPRPWRPASALRWGLRVLGLFYVVLGVVFLAVGGGAASYWIDAAGMTPLTARLFASPLMGLGLGLVLISRAPDWRQVAVPAVALVTIGILVALAIVLEREALSVQNPVAAAVAVTPLVLLLAGLVILSRRPASVDSS